jgi:hypothetical protein
MASKRSGGKLTVTPALGAASLTHELIIDDGTPSDALYNPFVDGETKGHGLVPRDYSVYPPEMFAPPSEMALIPRSEWSARIKEQEEQKARISNVLLAQNIPSMDQGPNGYCWGHSTVGAAQARRALDGQPYVPLSAYMLCAIIKKGVNEGGWCGLSAKFLREVGVCSQALWPQGNRDYRRLDTPEVRADAAKYKVTEDYVDLARNVYDQNLTFDQVATCLLSGIPCALDWNWWSHSVMGCDLVEVEAGSFGIRIRNSWGDSWGEKGFGIIRGNKAIPDGAVATRVVGGAA